MSVSCHPSYKIAIPASNDYDFNSGCPWAAILPDDTSTLGQYGPLAFTFSRSQVAQLWNARTMTLQTPFASSTITVDNIFQITGVPNPIGAIPSNPYPCVAASFSFPLVYALPNDDYGTVSQTLQIIISENLGPNYSSDTFFTDGASNYFPIVQFGDTYGTSDFCSTSGLPIGPGISKVGTFYMLSASGGTLTADINGTAPYGDVTLEVNTTWM